MKKVSDLIDIELDYAVAKCEGATNLKENPHRFDTRLIFRLAERTAFMSDFRFSTNWAKGGPIIEREEIGIKRRAPCSQGRQWEASQASLQKGQEDTIGYGPTPLIAAMRCYVASRLGDTVEIPDEIGAKQ